VSSTVTRMERMQPLSLFAFTLKRRPYPGIDLHQDCNGTTGTHAVCYSGLTPAALSTGTQIGS
jgi:hypothetical protein